jgi:hypothetical protein
LRNLVRRGKPDAMYLLCQSARVLLNRLDGEVSERFEDAGRWTGTGPKSMEEQHDLPKRPVFSFDAIEAGLDVYIENVAFITVLRMTVSGGAKMMEEKFNMLVKRLLTRPTVQSS